MIRDADEFHPVTAVRRRGVREARLEEPHRLVVGVRAQRLESLGRERGRNMRRVVPGKVKRHERGDESRGSNRPARFDPARQQKNCNRRRREDGRGYDRDDGRADADH